ncbi:MAG: creatininase family protein [Candidatus Heimdallarchaeota archaeon]|nr:MAG: creatininase family protein [Candidatus Heimdallarchaeota archaeon]
METLRIEEMNWWDVQEAINQGYTTVVIGIGSIEQHGPHLPTQTDALIGDVVANRVAARLKNALQAPTIRIGCSDHHLTFPGTISYKESTLKAIIHDYVDSLVRHGFSNFALLPSHGGNFKTTQEAIDEIKTEHPDCKIMGYTDLFGLLDALHSFSGEFGVTEEESGAHAGESETSFMLALAENLVKKERFEPGYIGPLGAEQTQLIFEKGMPTLTKNGILGDPTKASREKGETYLNNLVSLLVDEIRKDLES